VGDHHAHVAAALALHADAVARDRRAALVEVGADDLQQLALVGRTAIELEIDRDVIGDRG
jgi:hypothetical protein